jgi:colanic acid biosynthesis glycosyl transferase WcaI
VNILIVTQYFWPENFRINDLARELALRGHTVDVLTGIPNYPAGKVFAEFQAEPREFANFGDVRVTRVPMLPRGRGSVRLMLNYASFVIGACVVGTWKLRGRMFDVIFVYEPSPATVGLPAVLLGRIKKVPVVFWALDLWPETLAAVGVLKSPRTLRWVGHMVRFIYDRCALVLGQSRGFLKSLAEHCTDPSKIRYFPSWAEDVFGSQATAPAPEVKSEPGVFNVLFAGNIGEAQDLPAVLAAAELLKDEPNIRWLIVGDGRRSDWLQSEVARRGLESQVRLLGRFPVERMPSFYAHASALLVSLKKDPVFSLTIPGKVQSYLMSGAPVIGMLDGEGSRVISEARCGGVCAAGDSAGLAAVVRDLSLMSTAERRKLGLNGRAYAEKEFGRERLMDQFERLLAEAIAIHQQPKETA